MSGTVSSLAAKRMEKGSFEGIIISVFTNIKDSIPARKIQIPTLKNLHFAIGENGQMGFGEIEVASLAFRIEGDTWQIAPILLDSMVYIPEISDSSNDVFCYRFRNQFYRNLNYGLAMLDGIEPVKDTDTLIVKTGKPIFANYDRQQVLDSVPSFRMTAGR